MQDFLHKLGKRVMGVLSGFDRILFRGMLQAVVDARGLNGHLFGAGVEMKWLRMRRGVADLHRRAEISQASNQRLATALGVVLEEDSVPLKDLAGSLCTRVVQPGRQKADGTHARRRSFRAINPLNPDDMRLLTVVSKTEFVMNGLRNAGVRFALYAEDPTDAAERRRRSWRLPARDR